ncbi:MAG TPA: hypothetical protein VMQ10_13370 [Spirochaetia bacterium]|nr:hypothetical protein [Spirochaetia bacterium]
MKKVVLALAAGAALAAAAPIPAPALDGNLPVVTVRYEVAGGATEDAEDDTLESSSLRNTVSLRVKEELDPATLSLGLALSGKDYYLQAGDYSYLKLDHEAVFRVSDAWKVGYTLGAKWTAFPEPDSAGLSKDVLWLSVGTTAAVKLVAGTGLDATLVGRFALPDNAADARQVYAASAGLSARLGDWLIGARYRGEARLPLGGASQWSAGLYNVASVSLQWDPN